jgi:hypothetical protein
MTEEHLFAMVDDYVSENIHLKIMRLRETETPSGFHHTITPHIEDHPRTLTMQRTYSMDTNLQKMTLDIGEMYMWRTLYSVQYGSIRIPILDSSHCDWLDGQYEYSVKLSLEQVMDYYEQKTDIRENMMRIISPRRQRYLSLSRTPPRSPVPTQFPKFVTDALKRDAIQMNYTCPISMDPISTIPAAITSCYHIFSHNSITESLQRNKACPVCREPVAFVQPL